MSNTLPQNYKLNARYTILHQIGQGGFGITYKAYDSVFDRDVCIKELFLYRNSRREKSLSITSQAIGSIDFSYFKNKFLEEAKKLAKFDHPNIGKVLEYFEANNTAYILMDFVEGKNLKAYVQEKGKLDEETSLGIFNQLLQATEVIHSKNYLHRDIKPDNIIITPENKAVLIDFGTAKFHEDDNGDTSTLVLLSHGYAPPEQYSNEHKKDKYTDIYALGATFYFMLTGVKPIQATDRYIKEMKALNEINPNVKGQVIDAITKAMQLKPSDRYKNVEQLVNDLKPDKKEENNHNFKGFANFSSKTGSIILLIFLAIITLLVFWAQDDTIPQWKTDFEQQWTEAIDNETNLEPQENFDAYIAIKEKLPEDAIDEKNKVIEKITIYEGILAEEERIAEEKRIQEEVKEKKRIEEQNKKSGTFTDSRDNKTYKWVKIGNQVWMAENLAYKPTSGKYWAYNNDFSNVSQYGYLYDWETACKVCPNGWHLPSDAEWTRLTDYLGGENVAGTKMKSSSGWRDNGNGSNASGFSGLPGGYRYGLGTFSLVGEFGHWWSSSETNTGYAWYRSLSYNFGDVYSFDNGKVAGFSVRCLKD